MTPEEKNTNFKKAIPGFLVLFLIIGIYLYSVISDGTINAKPLNNFLNKANTSSSVDSNANAINGIDKDLVCLVYSEVGSYSESAKQGVASVVYNRIKSEFFPNNVQDVVYQTGQFESVYAGRMFTYDSIPEGDRSIVENAIKKAQSSDNTNGALFYYRVGQVSQSEDQKIRQMNGVTVIGDVVFMTTFPY
ncbi:MAG: cell wall hydrolase [Clostridia bacterium]|nr:cell wall hydrolase [Clostridia bacterium]